jgi:hypothetical protein
MFQSSGHNVGYCVPNYTLSYSKLLFSNVAVRHDCLYITAADSGIHKSCFLFPKYIKLFGRTSLSGCYQGHPYCSPGLRTAWQDPELRKAPAFLYTWDSYLA